MGHINYKEILEKAESYKNVYIEFNHRLDNKAADVHQETMGKVTLKGDLYHLNYMGTEQIYDGKKTYLIIHEDEEVIIQKPSKNNEETITPSKMFSFVFFIHHVLITLHRYSLLVNSFLFIFLIRNQTRSIAYQHSTVFCLK